MNPAILAAAEWLEAQSKDNQFCELGVKLIFHEGSVTRVEHSEILKFKPTVSGGSRNVTNR